MINSAGHGQVVGSSRILVNPTRQLRRLRGGAGLSGRAPAAARHGASARGVAAVDVFGGLGCLQLSLPVFRQHRDPAVPQRSKSRCDDTLSVSVQVAAPLVPTSALTGLTATVSGQVIVLSWTAPAGGDPVTSDVLEAGSAVGRSDSANVGATRSRRDSWQSLPSRYAIMNDASSILETGRSLLAIFE
jgi:hypothetical protein